MYAIIETGGKQYRVQEGDEIEVELLHKEGDVRFDKVLLIHDGKSSRVGAPHLDKCAVEGEVLGTIKAPKVIAFKYKPCKNYRRTVGHRQKYSKVRIKKIVAA